MSVIDWRYLTTKELGEVLGVTTQTILRWRNKKGLPAKKFSSRRLEFYIYDVLDWLDELSSENDQNFNRYYPYQVAVRGYINRRS